MSDYDFEAFFQAYVDCAIWSSSDDTDLDGSGNPEPMDTHHGPDDIADESLSAMRSECADFVDANISDLSQRDPGQGGHDFWLTRNQHGAGFWDGDWPEPAATRLTAAAHVYGESNLYVGDDGFVYVTP